MTDIHRSVHLRSFQLRHNPPTHRPHKKKLPFYNKTIKISFQGAFPFSFPLLWTTQEWLKCRVFNRKGRVNILHETTNQYMINESTDARPTFSMSHSTCSLKVRRGWDTVLNMISNGFPTCYAIIKLQALLEGVPNSEYIWSRTRRIYFIYMGPRIVNPI